MDEQPAPASFGPNAWLVDEMYEQYHNDPSSVSESWQEFFADYKPTFGSGNGGVATDVAVPAPQETAPPTPAKPATEPSTPVLGATPIRGAAARIVENMERSLDVPTATSFRQVPARLLEVNRKILNNQLMRSRGGKVSFTHIIGFAIVQALKTVPVMNRTFVPGRDGTPPSYIDNEHVNLGLAIDVTKSDRSHTLLVPSIKAADTLDFKAFWTAYEDLVRKVKSNRVTPDDFAGTTVTLTNPGTIGTVQSVPRLMPGQGTHAGVLGRQQGHHRQLHLRPSHHPGRGVRRVPAARARAAARRRWLL
jgi:2-oxoglutarate dehydrogenase E1 component